MGGSRKGDNAMTKEAKSDSKVEMGSGVELSHSEIADARREGALEAIKEGGKRAVLVDTGTQGDVEAMAEAERLRIAPDANTTFIAPLLDLSLDVLSQRLTNDKVLDPIDFETAKGLLALERAGRNRTGYVKALCERLGVKSPLEVTHAGPPYTNDETPITAL
jgi:hypothetical protein